MYAARAAALEGLAKYGTDEAKAAIRKGLDDKSWPVRWRAAELLRSAGDSSAAPAVPAPLRQPAAFFSSAPVLHPTFSPHVFLDTRLGSIELELDLVNAPVTSLAFIDLARTGFFNGLKIHRLVPNFVVQAGDPRGDSEGGPGFTLMDELSTLPYSGYGRHGARLARHRRQPVLHHGVAAAASRRQVHGVWPSRQRATTMLDRINQWDVIDRVRIWDGVNVQ